MSGVRSVFALLVQLSLALCQHEIVSECPVPNGFFADAVQCDKYYKCVEGVMSEKLCPDGMGFNDVNLKVEKCDFLFQVNCEGRPELQPSQATEDCPRANGYFPHRDKGTCNEFYYCTDGIGSHLTCPEGLVFSLTTGTCGWPDDAGRKECKSENLLNFTCPRVSVAEAVAHPRYPDPQECQFFYVCINGKVPRRNGCAFGKVFSESTKACENPKDVPECINYYKEFFDNYFADIGDTSRPASDVIAAAIASGYDVPANRIRVRPNQGPKRRRPTLASQPQQIQPKDGEELPVRKNVRPLRRRTRPVTTEATTTTTTTSTTTTTQAPTEEDYYDYNDSYYYDQGSPSDDTQNVKMSA